MIGDYIDTNTFVKSKSKTTKVETSNQGYWSSGIYWKVCYSIGYSKANQLVKHNGTVGFLKAYELRIEGV